MIAGIAPDNPTYPMWGFSFLAALFGTSLPWAQAAAATAVAAAGMVPPRFALATSCYSNLAESMFVLGGTTLC